MTGLADDGLRAKVRAHLPKPEWCWTAIETGATQQGVPDSFYAHVPTEASGWIEHKATTGWAVTMRPHQIGWHVRHCRAGVRTRILVRARGAGSSAGRGDSLWAVRGAAAAELAECGLEHLPAWALMGRWYGPPSEWDWEAVARLLTAGR